MKILNNLFMGPCFIILLLRTRLRTTFIFLQAFILSLFVLTESFNVFHINGSYMFQLSILFEKFLLMMKRGKEIFC